MRIPEAELIRGEITLRELGLPNDVRMTKKSLIRWLALSAGFISPNESRRTMLELLEAMLYFTYARGADPDIHEIVERISTAGGKTNEKALRYHLLQLRRAGFLERVKGRYRFVVAPTAEKGDLTASFEHVCRARAEAPLPKIKDALKSLKGMYKKE